MTYVEVHYATALDWFIICSFLYCMASLLEFAGVHYFTKASIQYKYWIFYCLCDDLLESEDLFILLN